MCVFSGMYFNNPLIQPTIAQIDQSFGATHPGGKSLLCFMCLFNIREALFYVRYHLLSV